MDITLNVDPTQWQRTETLDNGTIVYAAPEPYRLLLFIEPEAGTLEDMAGKVVDITIGWHQDKLFLQYHHTLPIYRGLKHTKVTLFRARTNNSQPAWTMDNVLERAPQHKQRADGQGRPKTYQRYTQATVGTEEQYLREIDEIAKARGTDRSAIVNEALRLYLEQQRPEDDETTV